jgi:hypothetical protein
MLRALLATTLAIPATVAASLDLYTVLGPEVSGATGSGFAKVSFDTVALTLAFDVDFQGLSGITTVAHIHCCVVPPGTVGVAVSPPSLPLFPVGVAQGTYNETINLNLDATFGNAFRNNNGGTAAGARQALLAGLANGTAYLNIHSDRFPSGEIRGFFAPVPEPGTFALAGLAVAGLLAFGRRK